MKRSRREIMELVQTIYGKQSTLLDVALGLHGMTTGASEFGTDGFREAYAVLQDALDSWEVSSRIFDACVYLLIQQALTDAKELAAKMGLEITA